MVGSRFYTSFDCTCFQLSYLSTSTSPTQLEPTQPGIIGVLSLVHIDYDFGLRMTVLEKIS